MHWTLWCVYNPIFFRQVVSAFASAFVRSFKETNISRLIFCRDIFPCSKLVEITGSTWGHLNLILNLDPWSLVLVLGDHWKYLNTTRFNPFPWSLILTLVMSLDPGYHWKYFWTMISGNLILILDPGHWSWYLTHEIAGSTWGQRNLTLFLDPWVLTQDITGSAQGLQWQGIWS